MAALVHLGCRVRMTMSMATAAHVATRQRRRILTWLQLAHFKWPSGPTSHTSFFQLRVLAFKLFQPARPRGIHAGVLRLPGVVRRFADPVFRPPSLRPRPPSGSGRTVPRKTATSSREAPSFKELYLQVSSKNEDASIWNDAIARTLNHPWLLRTTSQMKCNIWRSIDQTDFCGIYPAVSQRIVAHRPKD